jgi:hypothetical protein
MANALVDTPYLECGSLVVNLEGANSGFVVGHIDSIAWSALATGAGGADVITLSFSPVTNFDLATCLENIENNTAPNVDKPVDSLAKAEDYVQFSRDRRQMSTERQRLVVASAVSSSTVRKNIGHLSTGGKDVTGKVLRDSAVWEVRALEVLEKIQKKFPEIPATYIEESIRFAGAEYGGQPQAPAFKKNLLKLIASQQLAAKSSANLSSANLSSTNLSSTNLSSTNLSSTKLPSTNSSSTNLSSANSSSTNFSPVNFSPEARALMESFIDKVVAGRGKVEAIREYVKNQAAVDVARVIAEKRDALQRFATASAEEIGFAYQQLALQPAYATHSASDSTGLQAINEALNLFEAASFAEEFMEIDI